MKLPFSAAALKTWATPALAALGLADAAYLAILHWQGDVPPCHGYAGCAVVNNSAYAEIFGVSVAALGSLLYVGILGLTLVRVGATGYLWGQITLLLYGTVLSGALFMTYLTGVELLVLQAVCYWCVGLAGITLLLLILSARDVRALWTRGTVSLKPVR